MMSIEEHKLMLHMFSLQATMIKVLCDALVNKEILERDDLPAFGFAVGAEEEFSMPMTKSMAGAYQEIAKKLGLNFTFSFDR